MRYNKYYTLILTFLSSLLLTGCTDAVESLFSDNIEEGEEVMFTTYLSENKVYSRAEVSHVGDNYTLDNAQYSPIVAGYDFTIKMYERTEEEDAYGEKKKLVGTATYSSQDKTAVLKPSSLLYWPSTQKKYAFEATAGLDILSDKQTTAELVQQQDLLHGYAFEPTITNDEWTDNLNALNFHTPAEWSKINKQRGISDSRQIPLFIRHQRAMITVVLKAYNTYDKKKLAFENYGDGKSVIGYINSYDAETSAETKINPYAFKQDIIYGSNTEKTIAYQAVVEPHNYLTDNDVITEVKIAGSRYRFRPSNDYKYKTDETAKNAYNLQAGQHLIITATIGNDSRQISITAQIEDWDSKTINVSRDDFGNSGLQMTITNKAELIEFLNSTKYNVPGAVGIVTATSIDLDKDSVWESNYDLKATLNVAGATLCTSGRLLNNITSTGSLQNAKIKIPENVSLSSAVAKNNSGVINLVSVNAASTATATVAGLVDNNDKGIITNCSSNLHVYGDGIEYKGKKYVGGIAGVSHSQTEGNAIIAAIDGCKVDARVDGSNDVYGGGIAGYADGQVSKNTFEYGITLLQDKKRFKNIVADYSKNGTVNNAGNSWVTKDVNICGEVAFDNNYINPYDAVIDRQSELAEALTNTKYNLADKHYRLADSFTLTDWTTTKDVTFTLEGNNKIITTDGMLFKTISGKVSNLTVKVRENLIATSNDNNTDAIAPFAYAVSGENAEINNIKVKMTSNNYVQAANPSGLVVWAEKGAKIINCQSNAHVVAYLSKTPTNGASFLVGGIVSNANNAEISGCSYHADNSTLYQRVATGATEYDKVFFGGILGGINSTHEITLNDGNISDYDVLIKSCNSWFIPAEESVNTGTMVGNSVYNNYMLIDTNCQGNWWKDTNSPTIGNKTGSVGIRNSVAPSLGNHTDYNK